MARVLGVASARRASAAVRMRADNARPLHVHHHRPMSLKTIRNLDYTILLCDDLDRMRRFYIDVMGFPPDGENERWVQLRVGASYLT
jgi:hypothetical protein